jgi:hypothetical protein
VVELGVLISCRTGLYISGKRDVKVKALEAAEAARRLAEQKELEKQDRKKAAETAKREKQERAAQEKLAKREKAAQDKLIKENEEASKWKAAASGTTKSTMADSSNCQGTSSQNVLLKVRFHNRRFEIGSCRILIPSTTMAYQFTCGFGCIIGRLNSAILRLDCNKLVMVLATETGSG